jgi:Xaa-Pro aminopeptidase
MELEMPVFEAGEYESRLNKLKNLMRTGKLDMVIISYPRDIYYYTGSLQPMYYIVSAESGPVITARKGIPRIEEETLDIEIAPFSNSGEFEKILRGRTKKKDPAIGLCFETVSHKSFGRISEIFPGSLISDISWDIRLLRTIKSKKEIELIGHAGKIMAKIPEILLSSFHPGITELEMSADIEEYFRSEGLGYNCSRQEGINFGFGVFSAGINSLAPTRFDGICSGKGLYPAMPYGAGYSAVEKGVPVIVDFGVTMEGYHADQTRMFCWGEPCEPVAGAYSAMLEIENNLSGFIKPGMPWKSPYERSLQLAQDKGYKDIFMGSGRERVKFIGHGVGLELDEPPFISKGMDLMIEEGMVIAIEPKVSLAGYGVIGVEDTIVIKQGGNQFLTEASRNFICYDL